MTAPLPAYPLALDLMQPESAAVWIKWHLCAECGAAERDANHQPGYRRAPIAEAPYACQYRDSAEHVTDPAAWSDQWRAIVARGEGRVCP